MSDDIGFLLELGKHKLVYSEEEFIGESKRLDDGFRVVMSYTELYIKEGLYTFPAMMGWNGGQIYLDNISDFLSNFMPKVEDRETYDFMTDEFCEYVVDINRLFNGGDAL